MAYLLEAHHGLQLPRRLQIEFSRAVQAVADAQGTELTAADLMVIFEREYRLRGEHAPAVHDLHIDERADGRVQLRAAVHTRGEVMPIEGVGDGPLHAFVEGLNRTLGTSIRVLDYHEHAIGAGATARAAAYVELRLGDAPPCHGVGIDANIVSATLNAVLSGVLRAGVAPSSRAMASEESTT
jgi:2-isopropylmalate synthase